MSRAQHALDRAAQWVIQQEEPGWNADDQADFDEWLAASDGNKAAYWRLKQGWRKADRIKALGPGVVSPIGQARPRALPWIGMAIAASVALVVGTGVQFWPRIWQSPVEEERFETTLGSRKQIVLIDGTRIELNTASALNIAISPEARVVRLERGEAYFDVAHDEAVPFRIYTGDRLVTVLGTKFSVRQLAGTMTVSVVDGRVQLARAAAKGRGTSAVLSAGDVAISRGASTLVTAHAVEEVENALSWRSGVLVFDGTALSDAAADFNRYNHKPVVISPDVGGIRIGGRFPINEPEAFAHLLSQAYGLKVEIGPDEVKVSR